LQSRFDSVSTIVLLANRYSAEDGNAVFKLISVLLCDSAFAAPPCHLGICDLPSAFDNNRRHDVIVID
jgi:hypothetical protein